MLTERDRLEELMFQLTAQLKKSSQAAIDEKKIDTLSSWAKYAINKLAVTVSTEKIIWVPKLPSTVSHSHME